MHFALLKVLRIGLVFLLASRLRDLSTSVFFPRGRTIRQLDQSWQLYQSKEKSRPFRLTIACPPHFHFTFRRQTRFDSWAAAWGLSREWQTGHVGFDERVFIGAEDPLLLKSLSNNSKLRTPVSRLLLTPDVHQVRAAGGRLWLLGSARSFRDIADTEERGHAIIAKLGPQLRDLLGQLQAIRIDPEEARASTPFSRLQWIEGLMLLFVLAALPGWILLGTLQPAQVVYDNILRLTAISTVTGGLALLVVIIAALRRSSLTPRVLLDWLLAFLPSMWLVSDLALTWFNQSLDRRAPEVHVVYVESVRKPRSGRRGGSLPRIDVRRWPDPRAPLEVYIWRSQYEAIGRRGGCVDVTWHRGRLGDPWVSDYSRSEDQDCR